MLAAALIDGMSDVAEAAVLIAAVGHSDKQAIRTIDYLDSMDREAVHDNHRDDRF